MNCKLCNIAIEKESEALVFNHEDKPVLEIHFMCLVRMIEFVSDQIKEKSEVS